MKDEGHPARGAGPARLMVLAGSAALLLAACSNGGGYGSGVRSQGSPATASATPQSRLHVTRTATAVLPPAPAPALGGPAPGQQDLVFTAAGTGFLVSSGRAGQSDGQIQRTTDDGATWTTVWDQAGASLSWVGTVGSEVLASGTLAQPGTGPDQAAPLLLQSRDQGASWTSIAPSIPTPTSAGGTTDPGLYWASLRLDFVSPVVGLAVTDSKMGEAVLDHGLLRTSDGGRHWTDVSLPGGQPTGGLDITDPLHAFATGSTGKAGCESQIWSSVDSGASWQPVPGTCVGYILDSLTFLSANDGFAAGGNYGKYGQPPLRAVVASTDAGRHWSQLYAAGSNPGGGGSGPSADDGPFASLSFVDRRLGYALVGGCTMGANGPCGGRLWVTADGGRSWAPSSRSGLRLAVRGPQDLWLVQGGPGGGAVMWHSTDGARSWTAVTDLADVGISDLAASGSTVWLGTDAGQFISTDAGRSWGAVPAAARAVEQRSGMSVVVAGPAGLLVLGAMGSSQLWISHDGGRRGTTVSLPGLGRGGMAGIGFAGARHGLVLGQGIQCSPEKQAVPPGVTSPRLVPSGAAVLATDDGGASWHRVARLALYTGTLGYGRAVAVAAGFGAGPIPPCPPDVATSTDGGSRWRILSTPARYRCNTPSAAGDTAALVCSDRASATPQTTVLVSRDAGRSWNAYQLRGSMLLDAVVASGSGQLWAYGAPGVLWRSTDSGAHWSAVAPALPVAS